MYTLRREGKGLASRSLRQFIMPQMQEGVDKSIGSRIIPTAQHEGCTTR